jgi:hypothetical protein
VAIVIMFGLAAVWRRMNPPSATPPSDRA